MTRTLWIVAIVALAACEPAVQSPPVVDNTVAVAPPPPPPNACPRMTLFAGFPWQHVVFPQCPTEPFETDLPVCGSAPCPRPCRVTQTFPDIPPVTKEIRYDDRGQWLASVPITNGSNETLLEATYDGGRLTSFHEGNVHGDSRHAMTYEHGRLVQTTDLFDEDVRFVYQRDRVVRLENRVHASRIDYDAHGRITAVVEDDDDDQPTTYTYDAAGYVAQLVDGYKETSKYSYDEHRRLVHVASELHGGDFDGAEATLAYDTRGRLVKITNDAHVDKFYRYTTSYEYCDR